MKSVLVVFLGGGLGSVIRYGTSYLVMNYTNRIWIGTFLVNVLGSILFIISHRINYELSTEQNYLIRIGFLGGLTTFSSLSFQTLQLIKSGRLIEGVGSLVLNILFGIVIGVWIVR